MINLGVKVKTRAQKKSDAKVEKHTTEAYSEPHEISKMKRFAKIVRAFDAKVEKYTTEVFGTL